MSKFLNFVRDLWLVAVSVSNLSQCLMAYFWSELLTKVLHVVSGVLQLSNDPQYKISETQLRLQKCTVLIVIWICPSYPKQDPIAQSTPLCPIVHGAFYLI